jgi:hypothetical protein
VTVTDRQVILLSRYLPTLAMIHDVSAQAPARLREEVAANLSADAMREVYGAIPGLTWGRPDRTLEQELEEYGMLDLAWVQLIAMEAALQIQRRRAGAGG